MGLSLLLMSKRSAVTAMAHFKGGWKKKTDCKKRAFE